VHRLSALYDAEVAANDRAFGALLDALTARGLDGDTVVVFVSDHGEEFHEHGGWEHAETLYTEVIDVPLVIRFPRRAGGPPPGRRVTAPVQHADLMPTLLAALAQPVPPGLEGRDLTAWMAAGSEPDEAPLVSHVDRLGVTGAAVTAGPWRCIDKLSRPGASTATRQLYHRFDDPAEQHDLAARRPVVLGWCAQLLRAHAAATAGRALSPGVEDLDPELRDRLRALGYL
jgi:arylsulfatase A-like enzyme